MNTVVLDGSIPFGSQVTSANTIYIIEDVFDLNGGSVSFNDNCILRFDGGLLINAILIGNNTRVENLTNAVIFDNVELRYPVSSTSLTGWLGECRDSWFAYSDSPEYRINTIDPAKNRAHFAIVKSVSQFEICYFSPRTYYINVWETIYLRASGCIINGGGAVFMLLKNKGTTHPAWGNIPEYDTPQLFYKNSISSSAGLFSVSDLNIIDNDLLTGDSNYGANVYGIFISYMVFYGSGAVTRFNNVQYDGMGGLWGDYNYKVFIDEVFLSKCRVRDCQFAFVLANLVAEDASVREQYPQGGTCKSVIVRDCDIYNYRTNPYVGPFSIDNSGMNVGSSITKHLLIERSSFESQKEGNLELYGCETIEIRDCSFKSVQCSSENKMYNVDENTQAPIMKKMTIIGNTFGISDDLSVTGSGLRVYAGDILFLNNVVFFDYSKSPNGQIYFAGYGDNEAVLSGNTFVLVKTALSISKTMLVFNSCHPRLVGNNYTFLDDVPQYSEIFIDSNEDYYYLEVEDDPRFRNRGGGDYYSWQVISSNKSTADGLLRIGETMVYPGTLPSRDLVEFDLRAYAVGYARNGRHSFLSFMADDVEVYVQSYYGTFSIQIGQNYYASTNGSHIALPWLGFDTLGRDLATIKVVFWNDTPTETRALLYIDNTLVDTVSFPQISISDLSSLKLYGSPYLRIRNFRIRQYGMIVNNALVHSSLTLNYNDGYPTSGLTAGRPSNPEKGFMYYDTTLNKPIFYTGLDWIDALGVTV